MFHISWHDPSCASFIGIFVPDMMSMNRPTCLVKYYHWSKFNGPPDNDLTIYVLYLIISHFYCIIWTQDIPPESRAFVVITCYCQEIQVRNL